jgi:hypothetical protein
MNTYDAIMKAADQIEQHPDTLEFMAVAIPHDRTCLGCPLGWIGHFAGLSPATSNFTDVGVGVLGLSDLLRDWDRLPFEQLGREFEFYRRMDALLDSEDWRHSADDCAKALRLYAAKYHAVAVV